MAYLASRGFIARNRSGIEAARRWPLAGRPAAIINFLDGIWPRKPNARIAPGSARRWRRMHLAGGDFPMSRPNALSVSGWRPLFEQAAARADRCSPVCARFIGAELAYLESVLAGRSAARRYPCRPVSGQRVLSWREFSGLIDFISPATTCWPMMSRSASTLGVSSDYSFNVTKARALLGAYDRERALTEAEQEALPLLARGAALRFLLTRLVDVSTCRRRAGEAENPLEYVRKLRFQQVSPACATTASRSRGWWREPNA